MTDPLNERIREARERAGMTQQQVAVAVGVSMRTVGNWERGETVPLNRLAKLEDVLRTRFRPTTAGAEVEEAETPPGGERPLDDLLAEANLLTPRQQDALLAVVRAMRDPGEEDAGGARGQLVDLTRPPMPDLSRVAARRGESEGRRLREEQDDTQGS